MKKIVACFLGLCLSAGIAVAQPAGTEPAQIAVGKDNLIRVAWTNAAHPFLSASISTYRSDGSVVATGPLFGPFNNWTLGGIAVGPNNDLMEGWYESAVSPRQYQIDRFDSSDKYSSTYVGAASDSVQNQGLGQYMDRIAFDGSDNLYMFTDYGPGGQELTGGTVEMFNTSRKLAAIFYATEGAYSFTDGWQFSGSIAVRSDSHIELLEYGGDGSTNIADDRPANNGAFSHYLVMEPSLAPWGVFSISTTPNNHTQLYWMQPDPTLANQWDFSVWDIAANGVIGGSPVIQINGLYPVAGAACPFSGADGKLRVVCWDMTLNKYRIVTIDPASNWLTSVSSTL